MLEGALQGIIAHANHDVYPEALLRHEPFFLRSNNMHVTQETRTPRATRSLSTSKAPLEAAKR